MTPTDSPTASPAHLARMEAGGVVFLTSPRLARLGVRHAFSTRIGGISPPPRDSLSFGSSAGVAGDPPDVLEEAWRRLFLATGISPDLAAKRPFTARQVHGNAVAEAEGLTPETQADAVVSRQPGRVAAVRTADCCPVLLASHDGRRVAAIHAGWRGVVRGVIHAAVETLGEDPATLTAAIGPCIGPDAFEVGPEVAEVFAQFPGRVRLATAGDRSYVDLAGACHDTLAGLGVLQIDCANLCTAANRELFFSHRRDRGNTGQMVAIIAPLASGNV